MPDNKEYHLHLVSDATGGTLESITKAALVQFEGVEAHKHFWPMIRTPRQMERIVDDIRENPGLVLYTLVNDEIREVLIAGCKNLGLPSVSLLDPIIGAFGEYFGMKATSLPGHQYVLDAEYFDRIDALQYSMAHDDGQAPDGILAADIILVGVSRTSKTPTSMYLANRGYKTANIPFIMGCEMPQQLDRTNGKFVIGLTATPDRLVKIRTNRLRSIKEDSDTDYVDLEKVDAEIKACRRYCSERGWTVIDVTRRSIEETAAAILSLYTKETD